MSPLNAEHNDSDRSAITLADLYDADRRRRDLQVHQIADDQTIPHPLNNVSYADGISACRHAKKHTHYQLCRQEVRIPK